jgi:hypothetical protein
MLDLRVRPTTSLSVQPGQVLQRNMSIIPVSHRDNLAGDAPTDLMLDPGRLGTDTLRLGPENLSVLISTVLLTEIRSLVQVINQISPMLFLLDQ